MAFAYTVNNNLLIANGKNLVTGTFTNTPSDAGGEIDTGLGVIYHFNAQVNSHIDVGLIKQAIDGGKVNISTAEGVSGTWMAIGD